ncbi:MAG: hypothetical protein WCK17_17365 [Verrucomicrobiota bacterium]
MSPLREREYRVAATKGGQECHEGSRSRLIPFLADIRKAVTENHNVIHRAIHKP